MKKILLTACAGIALALGSCTTHVDDTTQTLSLGTLNLVTPLDGDGAPFFRPQSYNCFFNMTQGRAAVSVADMSLNNVNYSFATDSVPFTWYNVVNDMGGVAQYIKMDNLKGKVNNSTELQLRNFNVLITGLFHWNATQVTGVKTYAYPNIMGIVTYGIGNKFLVQSLQPVSFYRGTTVITPMGNSPITTPYTTDQITYRVVLDPEKKKAEVILYRAKFNENMPELVAIVLNDLDVVLKYGTYEVSGTNIVPTTPDAGAQTPNDSYMFEDFKLTFTDTELTKAAIDFNVQIKPMGNARFNGSMSGSYLMEIKFEDEKK